MIGLVVFNLWNTIEINAHRAVLDARRQADFTAAALRAVLRDARFLQRLPAVTRFELSAGALVVPAAVDWLSRPRFPKREDLDVVTRDKLEQIERGAIEAGNQGAVLQTLLRDAATEDHREWLRAHAAWHAHHTDEPARRDALLTELGVVEGGGAPAATILLHATARTNLPGWAHARITLLPPDLATPLLRRLRELGFDVAAIERRLAAVIAQRAVLLRVRDILPTLTITDVAVVGAVGDRLLLVRDDNGALLSRSQLRAALRGLAGVEWTALPATYFDSLSPTLDAATVTVVPEFLGVRAQPPIDDGVGGAWTLGLLVLAFASISGAGLWVFYRSVRRETEAARARSDFLTMVTHELKTPLAGIRLLAEMLQGGHVHGQAQHDDYYKRLNNESVRLTMLIENVLDLGRMERGERAYEFAAVDVDDLVRDAIELFEPIAEAAGLQITAPTTTTGLSIRGDRNALLQSLLNVMDNARKYAAGGHRLHFEVSRREYTCEILVRDHGPGVQQSERSKVFDRFQRGTRHANGSVPGVGLGLYLSRTILRNHGGELEAIAPRDGGPGVCFRFALPIAMTEAELAGSHQQR